MTWPPRNKTLRIVAYCLVALTFAIGMWRVETNNQRIERESIIRSHQNCMAQNESRKVIRQFIDLVVNQDGTISEFEQVALDIASESFTYFDCPPNPER